MSESETTTNRVLGGQLILRQPRRGHRAGHDAILLAAATPARPGDRLVELGAGVGTAGLAVARRVGGIDLAMVEIDSGLANLARDNAVANGLCISVHAMDVGADSKTFCEAGLAPDTADIVLMNPPFNNTARLRGSADAGKRLALMADGETLDIWTHAARRVLKSGGVLTMIWRSDGLAEVLASLGRGYGSVVIWPIYPNATSPAIRILVRAVKGGRGQMTIMPPLALNDEAGRPTAIASALLAGKAALELAL